MPSKGEFDSEGFYAALDGARITRNMNWKQVASAAGVSASTLTRMAQGRRPDVDTLAALIKWSGLDKDTFVRPGNEQIKPDAIAMISTYLRSDPHLTPEAATALDELVKATYQRLKKD